MKKAIIEASFGTSRINAFENSVLALKETFEAAFSDYEIFTALTSPKVLSALKKQGLNFDTADEALAVSMGEKAAIDMEYMRELTGKSEEELFADLKGVIFLNPLYGYGNVSEQKYLMAAWRGNGVVF